ncbi:HoxN/HupN/NixA family nickel/cobalt transporter [Frateuria defendens]|uniref:HoxN/HupN/NixA family nickel/cobalt transporter n=1 Tax=Frateuria defendens TaxID=2219559 RepID=UPI00066FF030|nr:HoxN/HupN/NixA family nickel/cobalt transporter [Frateuria defendens]
MRVYPSASSSAGLPAWLRHKPSVALLLGLAGFNLALWAYVLERHAHAPALLGTAFLAWLLGLRHAVDPDHIAAIDNVVRKLMQQDTAPQAVGLFFSLGHSLVVLCAVGALGLAGDAVKRHWNAMHELGGVIGTGVSALFLLLIALANLFILRDLLGMFRGFREGRHLDHPRLEMLLQQRGLLARAFRSLFGLVGRSWHMLPIGLLFGLGFDTASEIGLFVMAGDGISQGSGLLDVLLLPLLFMAGMTLIDTTDSILMTRAYGWAYRDPLRKLWYNLGLTLLSVVLALGIGGVEALGLIAGKLQPDGRAWAWVGAANAALSRYGYLMIGLFVAAWLGSMLLFRWRRFARLG